MVQRASAIREIKSQCLHVPLRFPPDFTNATRRVPVSTRRVYHSKVLLLGNLDLV